MQVKETENKGLSRKLTITLPMKILVDAQMVRLKKMKDEVRIKGFRPGHVPTDHLKRIYGQQVMGEIIEHEVRQASQKAIEEKKYRAAHQPEIKIQGEIDPVMKGESDLIFDVMFEVIPDIKLADFSKISIERPLTKVTDKEVEEHLQNIAIHNQEFTPRPKTAAAQKGDRVTIDFIGRIDGTAFKGGAAEGHQLELGSGQFIPGFEEQLIGAKAGDRLDVSVSFPENYDKAELAGKPTVFEVTVHEVCKPKVAEINDAFAERFGLENLKELKEAVQGQIEKEFAEASLMKVKRNILDEFDKLHSFELPESMVKAEYQNMWHQLEQELAQQGKKMEDYTAEEKKTWEKEYSELADRRVKLGIVLSEIGYRNKVEISEEEMQKAMHQKLREYPGQEQQVMEYFKNSPEARMQLRAPLFEDKVIALVMEKVNLIDKQQSREELFAEAEEKPKKKTTSKAKKSSAKKGEKK